MGKDVPVDDVSAQFPRLLCQEMMTREPKAMHRYLDHCLRPRKRARAFCAGKFALGSPIYVRGNFAAGFTGRDKSLLRCLGGRKRTTVMKPGAIFLGSPGSNQRFWRAVHFARRNTSVLLFFGVNRSVRTTIVTNGECGFLQYLRFCGEARAIPRVSRQ
jgi:hypothetical protein